MPFSAVAPPPRAGLLTPREAAALVGVSESTVRRWCDDDLVATARTAGGHRRIVPAALVAFAQQAGFGARIEATPRGRGGRPAPAAALTERFFAALARDGGDSLRTLVTTWLAQGRTVDALFDEVVAPAMVRLGAAWAEGGLAVYEEHRATVRLVHALASIDACLPPLGARAPVAVCAALSGDPYVLGPSMAGWVVGFEGFRAEVLGADTPVEDVVAAAAAVRAELVCLSIGVADDVRERRREVETAWRWCERTGATLAVGGRAHDLVRGADVPASVFGTSMSELARRARDRRTRRTARPISIERDRRARRGSR